MSHGHPGLDVAASEPRTMAGPVALGGVPQRIQSPFQQPLERPRAPSQRAGRVEHPAVKVVARSPAGSETPPASARVASVSQPEGATIGQDGSGVPAGTRWPGAASARVAHSNSAPIAGTGAHKLPVHARHATHVRQCR
jgi:hypothetical protein